MTVTVMDKHNSNSIDNNTLLQSDIDPATAMELSHTTNRGRRAEKFPDINLTAIALELGCDVSHVSRIFSGRRTPSFPLGNKLCEILNITPVQLEQLCNSGRRDRDRDKVKVKLKLKPALGGGGMSVASM